MMAAVYVYAPGADDFSTLGLCGPLTPTKCEFTERRNGMSQLNLDHPIDDYGRWSQLVPGCVLKAEVPVRTTPEIDGTALVTTVETWKVKTTATSGQRKLYSKPSGGRVLKTLPIWADKAKTQRFEVTVVRKLDRYKAKTKYGTGWINPAALEYSVTNTIGSDPAAIEAVESAWTTKPQLFRIREAVVSETGVSVTASHIFYDLSSNITTWSGYDSASGTNNPTCAAALAGILAGCVSPHEFDGYTNMLDKRVDVAWTRTAAVEALLAANTGLIDRWGAELVRDNYEFYVLREAGQNRGVRIEYGKNLLGVECTTDVTDVVARIMPVGKTSKGKDLFLVPGTYTVNGTTVTIAAGETWVTSPQAGDYPAPMLSVLDTGIKAKSGSSGDVAAARLKMIEAALNKFADEKCDQPSVNVKVTFVNLGDTVEYEQYKRLEDVFLCDRVRVRHPGIRMDVLTEVVEVVWDCLTGRAKSIELGRVQLDRARIKVPVWQLPSGIPGKLLATGTLGGGALEDGTVTDDQLAEAAVTNGKIAEQAVGTTNIQDAAIETAKIKDAAITTAKIGDAQITNAKIALLAVGAANIQDAAIETAKIADAAIERAKIATAAIGSAEIEDASIVSAKIALGAITSALIENGAIGTAQIADGSITDAKIVNLSANRITAGTLSVERLVIVGSEQSIVFAINEANGTAQLSQSTIDGGSLTQRTITADRIVAEAITAAEIASNAITANKILANAVTTEKINALAITTDKLAANAITSAKIAAGAITADKIDVGAVTASKIASGAITADKIDVDNLFASSAFLQKLQVSAAPRVATLPSAPAVGQSVIYTGVTPNEYLQWTGKGINPTQRRYSASKTGAAVAFEDLSDDHTLGVTVRTVAIQAGSGTPSPTNIRPISGKSSIAVRRRGKNLADPTITGVTSNGVTVSYDSANQTVTLNGTCTTNNTNFFFAVPPEQINAAHILSMYYVSGTAVRVGENSLWMAEASYANAFGVLAFPDAGRSSSGVVNAARNYVYFALRLDAGSVFTNYRFKLQLEFGSAPSDWEPYAAQAYALIPDAPLYGWGSAQDHVGTDGLAAHYMERVSLTGDEAFDDGSDLGDVVRIGLALSVAGTAGETLAISSHFPQLYSYASNTVHFYVTGSILALFIPKSILSTGNLAGAKAWVKAQATAGTPIQVLYQRANPVYAAVAPVAITGMDGTNTVTSDGASVTVSYTGSGWAAAGAVQRIKIKSFSLDPETGLRIDQYMGGEQSKTYMLADSEDLGFYSTANNKRFAGIGYDSDANEGYLEATQLRHPEAPAGNRFRMSVRNMPVMVGGPGGALTFVDVQMLSAYYDGVEIGGIFAYTDSTGTKHFEMFSRGDWAMGCRAPTGGQTCGSLAGGRLSGSSTSGDAVFCDGGLVPFSDGDPTLGYSNNRWKKVYAMSGTISTSDEREKHDIAPMDADLLTQFLMALQPVSYRLNAVPGDLHYGFTAQAFKEAMDAVGIPADYAGYDGSNPKHLGLCYTELIALLVAIAQQHQRRIDEQDRRIEALEKRLEALEGK